MIKLGEKMLRKFPLIIILFFLSFMLQGCTTLKSHSFLVKTKRPLEISQFFKDLDQELALTKTRNSANFPVKGFPYLRSNRFFVALKERLESEEQKAAWIEEMRQLDLKERRKEIQNLPKNSLRKLAIYTKGDDDPSALIAMMNQYSKAMLEHDSNQLHFFETLQQVVSKRSEYSFLMRVAGIYPLFKIPVAVGTIVVYDEFRHWHKLPLEELEVFGDIKTFVPNPKVPFSQITLSSLFNSERRDPLDTLKFTEDEIMSFVYALAPRFSQDIAADYDKFGEVIWSNNQVTINTDKPTVYYYVTHSFINNRPTIQLNYAIWYLARDGANAPWIEHGPLDGLTYRVTLDHDGQPIMADVMNSCGCYHLYFPNKEKLKKIVSFPLAFDPLVPAMLPKEFPEEKLSLRINSGWHQVQKIYTNQDPAETTPYQLLPYDILESLPKSKSVTESVFNDIGIMKNSTRIEPLIFFPMGIYDIGYMRQRGHHATKMIGKAHFTDHDFLDTNFEFK